jgi:hypothetical protein
MAPNEVVVGLDFCEDNPLCPTLVALGTVMVDPVRDPAGDDCADYDGEKPHHRHR